MKYGVETFARNLPQDTTDSVRHASVLKTASRLKMLPQSVGEVDDARSRAAAIKDYVLDHLADLLPAFEAKCQERGIRVHWARDAAEARSIIGSLVPEGSRVVKAKSMATEEIHLNAYLESERKAHVVETDLGEYVVQLDGDTPSHIVTPIIHKSLQQVAKTFEREGIGAYTEDAETLTMQARGKLRAEFHSAQVGISGVNFGIAESGRMVLVENEGNNRYSTTAPRIHIALMGIEKLLPRDADLPLFLRLLCASATGQQMGTYIHFLAGPRKSDEPDGPDEVHLVILDNGRSALLDGHYREILRCIRCGACLNVCPVYRQSSGHAYGHVYSGPVGAVLAPNLDGLKSFGHLAKASSLCGACEEVCPVKIPIPRMLLHLRDEGVRAGAIQEQAPWSLFAWGATRPWAWKAGLKAMPVASMAPHPMKWAWTEFHEPPKREGRDFRSWWKQEGK